MKLLKKSTGILLTLTILSGMLTIIPFKAGAAAQISYVERSWDEASGSVVSTTKYRDSYTSIGSRSSDTLTGWYYADSTETVNSRLRVSGTANLILRDGKTLTLKKGIRVPEGNTLNIYSQQQDSGSLVAKASDYKAAIGSNDEDDDAENGSGTINIHGGNVNANGGDDSAGIGGGNEAHGGNITIYGGTVTAKGGPNGAGIGSGDEYEGRVRGSITIYDGTVTATGGPSGAGIGNGALVVGGTITILGGTITAKGGDYGAGIGGGSKESSPDDIIIKNAKVNATSGGHAAGIGGGAGGSAAKITIANSTVNAISGYDGGAGIGGGYRGTNGDITITDSTVTVDPPEFNKGLCGTGAGIGSGFDRNQKGVITIERSKVYTETGNGPERGDGGGAGIGGGACGSAGTINIKDSEVVACAYGGAGIGGGDAGTWLRSSGGNGGNITIKSSKVTAVSRCRGAGIGGGDEGNGGTVVIEDSEVVAAGGSSSYVPVLYKPSPSATPAEGTAFFLEAALLSADCYGAGIGGGDGGDGANVTIDNSTVTALVSKDEGALGIGWGNDGDSTGSLTLYNDLKVSKVSVTDQGDGKFQYTVGETVSADKRFSTCRSEDSVQISRCDHPDWEWRWTANAAHSKYCLDCYSGYIGYEEHQWNSDNVCTVCGATAEMTNCTIIERNDDGTVEQTFQYPKSSKYTLPECTHAPSGMSFAAWKQGTKSDSPGNYFLPGETIYVGPNETITAVYKKSYETSYINKKGFEDTVYAGKVSETDGFLFDGWYVLDADIELESTLYIWGNVHLILPDGKTLRFSNIIQGYGYSIVGHNYDSVLNIYGQTDQTGTINYSFYPVILGSFNQYGGKIKGNVDITTSQGCINIERGTYDAGYTNGKRLSFRGGNAKLGKLSGGADGIILSWSSPYDSITFGNEFLEREKISSVVVAKDKAFTDGTNKYEGKLTDAQIDSLAGKTLMPDIPHIFNSPQWIWSDMYTQAKAVITCSHCDFNQEVTAGVVYEDSDRYRIVTARCKCCGIEYSTTETFQIIYDVNIESSVNGTVTVDSTEATIGDRVKLNVTPDEGYALDSIKVTDRNGDSVECSGRSFIMPESNVTVTATFRKLDEVGYIDSYGEENTALATRLSGSETELYSGWYYADRNLSFNNNIELLGNVRLILCDGVTVDFGSKRIGNYSANSGTGLAVYRAPGNTEGRLNAYSIGAGAFELVGGQLDLEYMVESDVLDVSGGSLSAQGIDVKDQMDLYNGEIELDSRNDWPLLCGGNVEIYGGKLSVKSDDSFAVNCYGDFSVSGGIVDIRGNLETGADNNSLTVSGGKVDVSGELRGDSIAVTGGNVNVQDRMFSYGDITLGWTKPADSIKAAEYSANNIVIADDRPLTDGADTYSGTYTVGELARFAGKTLTPGIEQNVPRTEPYIDDSGAYIPGTVAHYVIGGKIYAANEDGSVGGELDSVELSYFDFKLINNNYEYQINRYTGPTEALTELVIPKTYKGKHVTVLGNDINDANDVNCRVVPQNTPGFVLVLNEYITEIKPYSFYAVQVTGVEGNTSKLSKLGAYAFSWANSSGGYALDVKLDYPGKITADSGVFNHMNVTARIKHATKFNRSSFGEQSIAYSFTDAHSYGAPVWTWADDCGTATARFTCTDSRCKHEETVNAVITSQAADEMITYTAAAELDGNSYTDSKTVFADGMGARLAGHSISLEGDIAVNFYMELAPATAQSGTAYMRFNIPGTTADYMTQTVYVKDLTPVDGSYYVFKCRVPAKDMETQIKARLIDGDRAGTEYTYSVKDYADHLLEHRNDTEQYAKAAPLVEKMLLYGTYAKAYFDKITLDDPGVTEIPAPATEFALPDSISYEGATLSLKSETSLSLYFRSSETLSFSVDGKTFETAKSGEDQVVRIRGIGAGELQDSFTITVNGQYRVVYSTMNYCARVVDGTTQDETLINAVKALYLYSQAAAEYF